MGIIFFQLTEIKFESENTMNLQKIENYQLKVLSARLAFRIFGKHSKLFGTTFERTYFLLKIRLFTMMRWIWKPVLFRIL